MQFPPEIGNKNIFISLNIEYFDDNSYFYRE